MGKRPSKRVRIVFPEHITPDKEYMSSFSRRYGAPKKSAVVPDVTGLGSIIGVFFTCYDGEWNLWFRVQRPDTSIELISTWHSYTLEVGITVDLYKLLRDAKSNRTADTQPIDTYYLVDA